mgnify:FL=1
MWNFARSQNILMQFFSRSHQNLFGSVLRITNLSVFSPDFYQESSGSRICVYLFITRSHQYLLGNVHRITNLCLFLSDLVNIFLELISGSRICVSLCEMTSISSRNLFQDHESLDIIARSQNIFLELFSETRIFGYFYQIS